MGLKRWLPPAGVAALLVLVAVLARQRLAPAPVELKPFQRPVSELDSAERERFTALHAALRAAEQQRSVGGKWPAVSLPGTNTVQLQRGVYLNYLAVPAEPGRLRWLLLVIEPEPTPIEDPVPPEDEEHHTLADGTGIHVSVWSHSNDGPLPEVPVPFPAADGWVQRLSR